VPNPDISAASLILTCYAGSRLLLKQAGDEIAQWSVTLTGTMSHEDRFSPVSMPLTQRDY